MYDSVKFAVGKAGLKKIFSQAPFPRCSTIHYPRPVVTPCHFPNFLIILTLLILLSVRYSSETEFKIR